MMIPLVFYLTMILMFHYSILQLDNRPFSLFLLDHRPLSQLVHRPLFQMVFE
jgi:hypothetical protein